GCRSVPAACSRQWRQREQRRASSANAYGSPLKCPTGEYRGKRKRPADRRGVVLSDRYSTLKATDLITFPSCTTSQRQDPAGFSPSFLDLCVRQGDPPMCSFTRPTSWSL